jgi:FkbM family methyltransferase
MMISLKEALDKYTIQPKGVIHVGAHYGQEHSIYKECGVDNFVYIEPCLSAFPRLTGRWLGMEDGAVSMGVIWDGVEIVQRGKVLHMRTACGDFDGELEMNVSSDNEGQSNSPLKAKLHLEQHPEVRFTKSEMVQVRKLDGLRLDYSLYNILVADVQGYELQVLKGATGAIDKMDLIYLEVNRGETYEGNALVEEIDEYLKDFKRVETYWPSPNWTWGDAVYIRKSLL